MAEVEKKKRGRKPKSDKETNKQCVKESEKVDPQILHLNITRNISSNVKCDSELKNTEIFESDFCNYSPDLNEPNAYNESDHFTSKPCELLVNKTDKHQKFKC
jgi:phage regulator Rha-like protein